MSTQAVIARMHGDGYEGRYHHFDGYPTGLGAELYKLYHTVFKRDLGTMLKVLLDDHPAGWSTILGCDWLLAPGFTGVAGDTRPRCYCHGEREEESYLITEQSNTDCEWAYIFNEKERLMVVMTHTGHAGGDWDSGRDLWGVVGVVFFDKPEPDWREMEVYEDGEIIQPAGLEGDYAR